MALARKGKKGWISEGSQEHSRNLRGKQEVLKQNSWGCIRVWFAPVLSRGKLHVEFFGSDFPGESPEGAEQLVQRVRSALNIRFKTDDQPKILFTDRGRGFYNTGNGRITGKYQAALQEHGLTAFMGNDASQQPGDLRDVVLHETACSWLANRMTVTLPAKPHEETEAQVGRRLKDAAQFINENYDVPGLCREFVARVRQVHDRGGDRLRK